MFSLIHGNRQDVLVRLLGHRLKSDPPPLFAGEVVLVQSEAMARWLRLALAEELGIAAQVRFLFPAGYIWELFEAVLPNVPKASPFSGESLHWRLLRLLGVEREGEAFAPLLRYLDGNDVARRDSLAVKLAATFERYLAYRPDWLADWSAGRLCGLGPHEAWQAALWRELTAELPNLPTAHPRQAFFEVLARNPDLARKLPKRISLFGIGAMPPPIFEVLRDLGQYLDVTLYLLNPCREHWGHIVDARIKARAALERPEEGAYLETGHALLGSLGTVARQFFDQASSRVDAQIEAFEEREANKLLAALQADMLNLIDRQPADAIPVSAADDSLQIHVCHSPKREVDVLHDRLLALFEAHSDLRPSDVLVLTPDMETYAPLIEARFGSGTPAIPYSIADRPSLSESPLQQAFAVLLDLAHGRLEAESVLALLEQPPVARRWGFDDAALETLRDWVRNAAIRWGVDGAWRAERELPAENAHTWRSGFERLLLGLALPAQEDALFQHLAPAVDIAGSQSRDLGRFISFGEALFSAYDELNRARPVAAWAELFEQLLTRFCAWDEFADAPAAQALRQAWGDLAVTAADAKCEDAVPLSVVSRALDDVLAAAAPGWAFFGGGITFAALRAHRAVPVRVLCLLGMDDGRFPRNPAVPGFDLTIAHPRAGDRAYREEDRHAFLEALLLPRDALHISYVGRSVRDNSELPPSGVVAELLELLAHSFTGEQGDVLQQVVIEHPLQAFSRRYFDGSSGLSSFEQSYAAASRAAAGERRQGRPFLAEPLPEPETPTTEISLDELIRFLHNPARHLLRHRLGIQLEESEGLVESAEPFLLDGLERYGLDDFIVRQHVAGRDANGTLELARAQGVLPHGAAGDAQFFARWKALSDLASQAAAAPAAFDAVAVCYEAGGFMLTGQLSTIAANGLVLWRPASAPKGKDWLRLWVHHLALQLASREKPGLPRQSRLLTLDGVALLRPVDQPERHLNYLLALWQRGQRELLPFFPNTAYGYAAEKSNWQAEWSSDQPGCECSDPWFDLAFREVDPLADEFASLAYDVFAPILGAMEGGQ